MDIDGWLIDRVFQPVADRVDCFRLARVALLSAVGLQLVVLATALAGWSEPVLRLMAGGMTLLALFGADQARHMIDRVERQTRTGTMNVRRITLRQQRVAWLGVCVLTLFLFLIKADLGSLCNGLASSCWFAALAFASCTGRPPPVRRSVAAWPGLARAVG